MEIPYDLFIFCEDIFNVVFKENVFFIINIFTFAVHKRKPTWWNW